MASLPSIGVQAVVEGLGKYVADMGTLNKATSDAAGATEKAAKSSNGLSSALASVGKVVAGLGLAGLFGAMVKSASDSQTVVAQLDNVLKSTSGTIKEATATAGHWATVTTKSGENVAAWEKALKAATGTISRLQAKQAAGIPLTAGEAAALDKARVAAGQYQAALNGATTSKKVWVDASMQAAQSAGFERQAILDLASSLQKVTRFSDESILSVEIMLMRFKGMSQDVLPKATKAVLDIATAMGIDTGSAAKLLGKLMQDPIGSMQGLTRAGIKFTAEQEKQVKALVKSGKLLEAQKYLLDQVAIATGGAAEAAGNTFAGKLDILKNAFDDILETVGGALLPILTDIVVRITQFIDALGPAAPVILAVAAALGAMTLAAGPLGVALGIILSPIGAIVIAVGALAAAFATNFGGIRTAVESVAGPLLSTLARIKDAITTFFSTLFGGGGPQVGTSMSEGGYLSAFVVPDDLGAKVTTALATLGKQIKSAIKGFFDDFLGIDTDPLFAIIDKITPAIDSFVRGVQGFIANLSGADTSGLNVIITNIANALSTLAGLVGATVISALDAIGKSLPALGTALKEFINAISALGNGDLPGFFNAVGDGLSAIGTAALNIPLDLATRLGSFLGIDVKAGLEAWSGIRDSIGIILDAIWQKIQDIWQSIQDFVGAIITNISTTVSNVWNDILTIITTVMTSIQTTVSTVWNEIVKFVEGILGTVRAAFQAIADAISGAINSAIATIQNLINLLKQALGLQADVASGSSSGNGGAHPHARGGPFAAMETILVGEKGPELVTFAQGGFVIPNNILQVLDQIATIMAAPSAAPIASGSTYTNNYNQRTMGDVVFQGVPGAQDAMRRYALMRALGRV